LQRKIDAFGRRRWWRIAANGAHDGFDHGQILLTLSSRRPARSLARDDTHCATQPPSIE
jgi:hypothetical protein